MKKRTNKLKYLAYLCAFMLSAFIAITATAYAYMEIFLPSVSVLKDAKLQVPLRIYTADGKLISEYGNKRRIPIPYNQIPPMLIHAVLATEDKRFFNHSGVDIFGLGRAGVIFITTGRKTQGGSTITMQVARNFFLTSKKTFSRKFKEILLAIKIDKTFTKQKILDLYFNKVFLGKHAYGFAAAAKIYYGKPLSELSLAEYAMLAGLPKAPSSGNPISNPDRAIDRRNHVLKRMYDSKFISSTEYQNATKQPVTASYHNLTVEVPAPHVAELIGNYLNKQYGGETYSLGLQIYTTLNSKDQLAANAAVKQALFDYDKRHGYRTPSTNLGIFSPSSLDDWKKQLNRYAILQGLHVAAVTEIFEQSAQAILPNGDLITLSWEEMSWARPARKSGWPGALPKTASQILKVGDVIRITQGKNGEWQLSQIPEVEGALVAVNPESGAIQALVGGLNFQRSSFNRAMKAKRQVGSSIKPFIYAAALDKGMTLATVINDAPIVIKDSGEHILWRPQNDTKKFYGPTRLRVGLTQSRNLVSIRILKQIGLPYATDYLTRFGFTKTELPQALSLALGTPDLTPMQMAKAYSVFANGGFETNPYILNRITNGKGKTIYQAKPQLPCSDDVENNNLTDKKNTACEKRVISTQTAYLMTNAMRDVIQTGTGRGALSLRRKDLAGKTGTTNDQNDAWFAGFNPNLVAIAWVGFDAPKSLHEYGSRAALPMWVSFMKKALRGQPQIPLHEPTGIVTARIDAETGKVVGPNQPSFLYEKFREENVPTREHVSKTTNKQNKHSSSAPAVTIEDLY
jgi:penicillin-binding protein 1A